MTAAKRELLEIWVGAAIMLAIVAVLAAVFGPSPIDGGTYEVSARFSRADGLRVGSIVRAAGVPVGKVRELRLDNHFRAVADMQIDKNVELDTEATAAIVTDGLFGKKFVQLDIGGGDKMIGNGGEIAYTEGALILDDLLELIVSRARQAKGKDDEPGASGQ